jgi:hypothetical protein
MKPHPMKPYPTLSTVQEEWAQRYWRIVELRFDLRKGDYTQNETTLAQLLEEQAKTEFLLAGLVEKQRFRHNNSSLVRLRTFVCRLFRPALIKGA